ncbi:dihydrolipoamide acetyltransferase family protein [Candidatus Nitrospira bockiana]
MAEFVMPTLGADMDAGTLVAWRKKPGDRVTRGDIIAEVETEKAAIDVEVFTSGVVETLLVQPGEKVPVGTVMAVIREDRPAAAIPSPPGAVRVPATPAPSTITPVPQAPCPAPSPAAEAPRIRISPAARQRAVELGVDPASVRGTGPDGAITRDDVERHARGPRPDDEVKRAAALSERLDRQARMRQTIAAAMARSKREIPHYYLSTTIDLGPSMAWLAEENRKRSIDDRLLYNVLLIKAVALALRDVPELNGVWQAGRFVPSEAIHCGVAVSLRQGGLVAPAVHETDKKPLTELMREVVDLVRRARAGSLRSSELSDPTVTITNLGEQGVESVFGVIYPPQVALVGFGKVLERPWVVGGAVVPRPVVTATLSADHRVSDGHRGGLFLAAVERLLQSPERL